MILGLAIGIVVGALGLAIALDQLEHPRRRRRTQAQLERHFHDRRMR